MARISEIERKTTETEIYARVNLDGFGNYKIDSGNGFFNHMLELFSKHSGIDITIEAKGDSHIDWHHTVEDIGITLGKCIYTALSEKRGIARYGHFTLPMDEVLVDVALDFGGRNLLHFDVSYQQYKVGELEVELVKEFFKAFADNAKCNLHITKRYGENTHHIVEGIFKCFAKAVKMAVKIEGDSIPSTKGALE